MSGTSFFVLLSLFLKRWVRVYRGIYDTVYRIIVAFRSQCNKRRKSKTVAAEGVRLLFSILFQSFFFCPPSGESLTTAILQHKRSSFSCFQAGSLMVSGIEVFGHFAPMALNDSQSIKCLHYEQVTFD